MSGDATPVMVTGHRVIPGDGWEWVAAELRRCLLKLQDQRGPLLAIQGMALGVDMLFAETALTLGIPFDSYVPFPGQAERWPAREQVRHASLLAASHSVIRVAEEPITDRYAAVKALHARNDAMIRDSAVAIAVLDGRTAGGTRSATAKALKAGLDVLRINPSTRCTAWIRSIH